MTPTRGRFIALEGGEGAGKTTQIRRLGTFLEEQGITVLATREPGGTPEGQELRRLLLTDSGAGWSSMAETLLMIADRAQHIDRLIRPALEAGTWVISDRFVLSTLAYQGSGRGVPESQIRELHRLACGDLWPDLTLVLDIDPAVGLARSRQRLAQAASGEDKFERLDDGFHARVRATFLAAAKAQPAAIRVVEANGTADEVARTIADIVGARTF